jgi:hypothetical protein
VIVPLIVAFSQTEITAQPLPVMFKVAPTDTFKLE